MRGLTGFFAVMTAVVIVVAGAAFFIFSSGSSGQAGVNLRPDDAKLVATGKVVYGENCASCHGENLEGQPNWRSPGEDDFLPAPPHNEKGHTWHHTDDLLFGLTKLGAAKLMDLKEYKTKMPIFDGILTDEEILAALSYIKSTWPKKIRKRHDQMNAQRKQEN